MTTCRGFGAGYYNGFGGKVEAGETVQEAALREVRMTWNSHQLQSFYSFTGWPLVVGHMGTHQHAAGYAAGPAQLKPQNLGFTFTCELAC